VCGEFGKNNTQQFPSQKDSVIFKWGLVSLVDMKQEIEEENNNC
jgi:hypothetical protein